MSREDLKNIVVDSLINKDPNGPYFYKKMYNHLTHKDPSVIYSAPVNPNYLQPLDIQHSIIFEDNVFDALETIDQYNIDHKKEVPFILYGYETKGGAIVFDDIYCDFNKLKEDLEKEDLNLEVIKNPKQNYSFIPAVSIRFFLSAYPLQRHAERQLRQFLREFLKAL